MAASLVCLGAEPQAPPESPGQTLAAANSLLLESALLEQSGAVVGGITIQNRNVFDLADPRENKSLFRLANRLHMTTRADVIRQQLLFEPGEPFIARELAESERLLRSNRYIRDASIWPIAYHEGRVDIAVETTDVWTFMPRLSFSRAGGANRGSVGLREMNLFGSGAAIELAYKTDIDRQSRTLRFIKNNLGNSWYGIGLNVAKNSDGYDSDVEFGKPFYSFDSKRASGISARAFDRTDSIYEHGDILAEYQHRGAETSAYAGWSSGLVDGWVTRYIVGLGFEQHRFDIIDGSRYGLPVLPEDRRYAYPFVGIERMQDKYEKTSNFNRIHETEDRYLGTRLAASIGLASTKAGSSKDALIIRASGRTGFGSSEHDSLILESVLNSRVESGRLAATALELGARYYRRQSDRRLFYVGLRAGLGHRLDADQFVYLGGDNGLRGYPARYQVGRNSAQLTIEQRLFTNWYPFRIVRVGGALFFDAGKVWGGNPYSSPELGLLHDVGIGLRLASTRSGTGRMIHVDLAFPLDTKSGLDSPQLLISTHKSF